MKSKSNETPRRKKPQDPEKVKVRLAGLCVRAEQCRHDIVEKLRKADIPADDKRAILAELIAGKFIDDARYARSFARDKVRFAGWGRLKVQQALRLKKVDATHIRTAMEEIDDEEYAAILEKVARRKSAELDLQVYEERMKLMRFLQGRGFEPNLSVAVLGKLRRESEQPECE